MSILDKYSTLILCLQSLFYYFIIYLLAICLLHELWIFLLQISTHSLSILVTLGQMPMTQIGLSTFIYLQLWTIGLDVNQSLVWVISGLFPICWPQFTHFWEFISKTTKLYIVCFKPCSVNAPKNYVDMRLNASLGEEDTYKNNNACKHGISIAGRSVIY